MAFVDWLFGVDFQTAVLWQDRHMADLNQLNAPAQAAVKPK